MDPSLGSGATIGRILGLVNPLPLCYSAREPSLWLSGPMTKKIVQNEPKTLLQELHLQGHVKAHSQVQMAQAKKYYVKDGLGPKEIYAQIGVDETLVRKWILLFGWDEERDRHEFNKYRKIVGLARDRGVDIDGRADRLMAKIETVVEEILEKNKEHMSEKNPLGLLKPKDLAILANCVKTTHTQRRETRKKGSGGENKNPLPVAFQGSIDIIHRIGAAVADVAGQDAQLKDVRSKVKELNVNSFEDAEFEVMSNGSQNEVRRQGDSDG